METVGLIIEKDKKILLQLRDNVDSIPYPDTWTTFGGRIEKNETPLQALKRELHEELEYEVEDAQFVGKYRYAYVFRVVDSDFLVEGHKIHEGQKARFFDAAQLQDLDYAFHIKSIIQDYVAQFL